MRATQIPRGALLSRRRWRELGVSSDRLCGPQFETLLPGHLTPRAAPASFEEMLRVLQTELVPGAVLSHTTAAVLYGVPVPASADDGVGLLLRRWDVHGRHRLSLFSLRDDPDAPPRASRATDLPPEALELRRPHVHIRIPPGRQARAGPHVTVHRMARAETRVLRGLTLSAPREMLLELAVTLEHDELVIAIDHLLGPRGPFGPQDRDALQETLVPLAGRRGYRALVRAVEDAREGVESPGETRTRLLLSRAGFPEPALNLRVRVPSDARTRRLDLAYEDLRVAIEYDGDVHRSRGAWREDQARRDSLESMGWTFRRLTAADIRAPGRFLDALRRTFLRLGADAPAPDAWRGTAGAELSRPRPRPAPHPRPRPRTRPLP